MTTSAHPGGSPAAAAGVPRWPAAVAMLVAAVLLALVSNRLTVGPSWLTLAIVLVLTVPITIAGLRGRHDWRQRLAYASLSATTLLIAASVILLVQHLLVNAIDAPALLSGAAAIWVANCVIFAVWYWEIDGGGPAKRRRDGHVSSDFLFPQLQIGDGTSSGGWWPGFIDYLFVAWNASTAFSPTDTLILTRRAKVLMMIQSLMSLVTIAVLAARAINTIK